MHGKSKVSSDGMASMRATRTGAKKYSLGLNHRKLLLKSLAGRARICGDCRGASYVWADHHILHCRLFCALLRSLPLLAPFRGFLQLLVYVWWELVGDVVLRQELGSHKPDARHALDAEGLLTGHGIEPRLDG